MKKIFKIIGFFIVGLTYSQEVLSYNIKGKNIRFTLSTNEFYIKSNKSFETINENYHKISPNSGIIKKEISGKQNKDKRKSLMTMSNRSMFDKIEPILIYKDGTQQIVDGKIIIKIKETSDVRKVLKNWNFRIEKDLYDTSLYFLYSDIYNTESIFDIVNQLNRDSNVIYAEPNFTRLVKFSSVSDPFLSQQWAIKNSNDVDMQVYESWKYSTGKNIKVAVLDEGIDLNHPDLKANLLQGFDATGNNSEGAPNYNNNDAHGTACAGIIAAVSNNIGGVGVSYDSKILPVRIAYSNGLKGQYRSWIYEDSWISNGINWAWKNGADILSNSWGGGSHSYSIENAIKNAVEKGRNGKGSIVLFSSGNNNSQVNFPATLPNVIAVGASSMCDERKSPSSCDFENWGSNYGSQLDIVAPGVNIYTTDISGANGYTYGDYKSDFNGTSSACPNVAGVMALILSANPNLTQKQARDILEQSTDKVRTDLYQYQTISGYDNGTWNNEVGYGRVNALKAIQKVYAQKFNIQGSSVICDNTTQTYTIDNNDDNSIQWQLSSDIEEVSRTANSITIKPKSGFNGLATLTASNGNSETTKKIWIGKPKVHTQSFPLTDMADIRIVSDIDSVNLAEQGITYNDIVWHNLTTGEKFTTSNYYRYIRARNDFETIKATVTNPCGTVEITTQAIRKCKDEAQEYIISRNNRADSYSLSIKNPITQPCISDDHFPLIATRSLNTDSITIQISNAMGQIVLTTKNKEFSLAHLLSGTYYARVIKNGQVVHTQTLLKQ